MLILYRRQLDRPTRIDAKACVGVSLYLIGQA